MASKRRKGGGSGLGFSIFLVISLLVTLTAGSAVVATFFGRDLARKGITQDLRRSNAAQAVLQQKRFDRLELAAQVVTSEGQVAELLAGVLAPDEAEEASDTTALAERLDTYRQQFGVDRVLVLDAEGLVVAPGEGDLSGTALFRALGEKKTAMGVWLDGEELYHAVVLQMVRDFELAGHLVVAQTLDSMAGDLGRATGAEVVYFAVTGTGPSVVATYLDATVADDVIAALRREGQALAKVTTGRGQFAESIDLELDASPWAAFATPLRDASDAKAVGGMVALVAVGERLAIYQQIRLLLFAVAGGALVVAFFVSMVIGRRTLKPMARLAAAADEVSRGNYAADIPRKGSFAAFGAALAALADRLGDKEALEEFVQETSRHLPEPARSEETSQPQGRQVAVVGVEMRRFVNPKAAYDPEEHVSRLGRDLRRITTAVAARQGSLESVLGHRLLAVFDGEGSTLRAVTAATEILLILTHRENAFDEPSPPAVAVANGPTVTGSVSWGDRRSAAALGVPVQQLDMLLREAAPGNVYFSKNVAAELSPAMQQAGAQLMSQKSLLNPQQPLYLLQTAAAQTFTGAQPPASQPESFTANTRTLSDISPGELLANRFEVVAELGAGPHGLTFKSLDRDRGDLVTLKLLRPELYADDSRAERLKQALGQARLIAHPRVLGILDLGDADGLAYVTSRFVRAMSLRWVLARKTRIPIRAAFLAARQILKALHAAHQTRAIHGGLKPENVLLDSAGARVMDFSLAAPLSPEVRDQPLSGAAYLAPEQIDGREAGPESDLYAWGAVLYEMLAGQPPVGGASPGEVQAQLATRGGSPPRPSSANSEVPAELEKIVLRCLAKEAGQRYKSAAEVLAELEALRS